MADFYKSWVGADFYDCPVCGERFYIPPYVTEWGYKIKKGGRKRSVFSYSCMSKVNKKTELKGEHYLNNAGKWQQKSNMKRSDNNGE